MKKFKRVLVWVATQTLNILLMWFGVHGNAACWNLFRFFAWMCTTIYIGIGSVKFLGSLGNIKEVLTMQETLGEQPVNKYVSYLSDLAIVATLVYFGHIGYGALILIQQYAEQWLFSPLPTDVRKRMERNNG